MSHRRRANGEGRSTGRTPVRRFHETGLHPGSRDAPRGLAEAKVGGAHFRGIVPTFFAGTSRKLRRLKSAAAVLTGRRTASGWMPEGKGRYSGYRWIQGSSRL